jgi:CHAD domain-containing protein
MPSPNVRRHAGPGLSEEVAQFARITLPREAKTYFNAGDRAARKHHSLGRLHEFRLHGKSLRYSLELFEPLYGPRLNRLTKLLKRTQQLLGEMADARAGLKLVKQMNAPDSVLSPLRRLANEKREAFAVRWVEEVPDETVAAQWVEYLRRYASARAANPSPRGRRA